MAGSGLNSTDLATLKQIIDRRRIEDVLLDYCRAADRGDRELMRTVWFEDAVVTHGSYAGPAKGLLAYFESGLDAGPVKSANHRLTNIRMCFDSADSVRVESHFFTHHTYDDNGTLMDDFIAGRYLDVFERRSGIWRIANRRFVYDWARSEPVSHTNWLSRFPGRYIRGSRSKEDPSYGDWAAPPEPFTAARTMADVASRK